MNLKRLSCTILIVTACLEPTFAGSHAPANSGEERHGSTLSDSVAIKTSPDPILNINNVRISPATCTGSNGSIINLTASNISGTPFMQWVDLYNRHMGHSFDLTNVPAGKYRFKYKDSSLPDTLFSPYFTVSRVGEIKIDTVGKHIGSAGCVNRGSIHDLRVTGADTYQWKNLSTATSAGSVLALDDLAAGEYQLTASNALGCSVLSPVLTVPSSSFIPIGVTGTQTRNAVCGENNGILRITRFNSDSNQYSFRWIDSTTKSASGIGTGLHSLGAGTYMLFATDSNGCESQLYKGTIRAFGKPSFDLSGLVINDDNCSLKQASIKNIQVMGLSGPAASYSWTNADGEAVNNRMELKNVGAGQYSLIVIDAGICLIQTPYFTVINHDQPVVPQYEELTVPRNNPATLRVRNFVAGTYILYNDAAGTQIIEKNETGVFTTKPLADNNTFYVRSVTGTCTSELTAVKVIVVDKSFFAVPTAFTPNGDGINDQFVIKSIGLLELEYFQIYDRMGQIVFTTKAVNTGWDGRYKGIAQPTSGYVWLAKGKDINGKAVVAKGTFVLIK